MPKVNIGEFNFGADSSRWPTSNEFELFANFKIQFQTFSRCDTFILGILTWVISVKPNYTIFNGQVCPGNLFSRSL